MSLFMQKMFAIAENRDEGENEDCWMAASYLRLNQP